MTCAGPCCRTVSAKASSRSVASGRRYGTCTPLACCHVRLPTNRSLAHRAAGARCPCPAGAILSASEPPQAEHRSRRRSPRVRSPTAWRNRSNSPAPRRWATGSQSRRPRQPDTGLVRSQDYSVDERKTRSPRYTSKSLKSKPATPSSAPKRSPATFRTFRNRRCATSTIRASSASAPTSSPARFL